MSKRPTNAQLQAQLEALRHNANLLEIENARLRAELEALRKPAPVVVVAEPDLAHAADMRALCKEQLRADVEGDNEPAAQPVAPVRVPPIIKMAPRTTRPVFEFDPAVPGDFVRAAKLAREFKGCTRRCA